MTAIKACFPFGWHNPAAIQREGQTERKERQLRRSIDGETERGGDAILSRSILKFSTQEPVVKSCHYLVYERRNNMDGSMPYHRLEGV